MGSEDPKVIVECKAQTWTDGDRIPSVKMKNWVETMFYFYMVPTTFRKIFFAERSERKTTGETLLCYFIPTHFHMIASGVEFWKLDSATGNVLKILPDSEGNHI